MKAFRTLVAIAVLAILGPAASAANLVDAQWLAKHLESPEVLLLDASPRPLYAKGHIPGAVSMDAMAVASFGVRDVPPAQVDRAYQALGIDASKRLVIYDQGGSWFAPRIFFELQYRGFPVDRLAILDGGLAMWQAEGLPVSKDPTPAPTAGTFKASTTNEALRSRIPDLLVASGDRTQQAVIDALGPEYHYGAAAFFDKSGHIPNALLMPAEDFFNADKTFKAPDDIRRMAAHLGIRTEQEVHTYCGGGGAAAVPYFALKQLAGYSKVKLSVESQMGWLQDERSLPMWTYAAPAMMRDGEWLPSWGGRMMRMYGVSHVSVVDVRAPSAYAQGHVPFAVNVPGDTFRMNAKDAQKLAAMLGASGVKASDEAVIVSGGGVTRDAALAYVVLERLGQKKVSIFMDSLDSVDALDRMSRKGFAVTKDATTLPAAAYTASARESVIVGDAKSVSGVQQTVFIASGAAMPKRAVEGKLVHVPYTDLLNADGTPKPAKDIWAVLSKAGVPRYAELVTVSDDPGEAAANYYILALMGWRDLKVLMP